MTDEDAAAYEPPALIVLGTLAELTRGDSTSPDEDGLAAGGLS